MSKKKEHQYNDIHEAIKNGDLDAVKKWIRDQPESINKCLGVFSSLDCAIESENLEALEALLAAGADPNRKNGMCQLTALHYASHMSEVSFIQRLIAAGADLESQDYRGATPLHYAVTNSVEAVLTLLGAGANLEALNSGGRSVLDAAKAGIDHFGSHQCREKMIPFVESLMIAKKEKEVLDRMIFNQEGFKKEDLKASTHETKRSSLRV